MSDETTLLPCPFCGGEAHISDDYSSKRGMVYSVWHDCPAGGGYHPYGQGVGVLQVTSAWFSSREEAIAAWNTRTHGTLTAEQVRKVMHNCSKYANWQAIADELNAKLESDDDYEHKMDELLCRLTNGKWSKSRAYSIEFMVSCVDEEYEALYSEEQFSASVSGTLTAEQVQEAVYKHSVNDGSVYSVFKGSFQAIADELNAELGSGTCEWVLEHSGTLYDKWRCSKCGYMFVEPRTDQGYTDLEPNFCPKCGRKVVS